MPLWEFAARALNALSRALSLVGVPRVVIRDLPPAYPCAPPTPPPHPIPPVPLSDSGDVSAVRSQPRSVIPSLSDLIEVEEHEVSVQRARGWPTAPPRSAAAGGWRQGGPFYVDATTKAVRVKAAQRDLSKASARMKTAIENAGLLARPSPSRIGFVKLRCLGRACGLGSLAELEDMWCLLSDHDVSVLPFACTGSCSVPPRDLPPYL